MKQLVRPLIAIGVGVAISAVLHAYVYRQSAGVSLHSTFTIDFLKVVQPSLQAMLLQLFPWFVSGLIAKRWPILCGSIGGAAAVTISRIDLWSSLPTNYIGQLVASSAALAIIAACYGAAGAALGFFVRGSNNSFKPNPHRSFKTPCGFSGGSA